MFFDLVGHEMEGYNKFIPYYLYPGVHLYGFGFHVQFSDQSVGGVEPVGDKPLKYNLATICERYGGGGHPKVGAISFEVGAIDAARKAASEIAAELRS